MITLKFEGGKDLQERLAELSQRVSSNIQRAALKHAAEPMRRQMELTAPHEPGKPDLRDDMVISNAKGDTGTVAVAVGPSRKGYYGSFQELGTAHIPARPFVRPAFDQQASAALVLIKEDIWLSLVARGGIVASTTVETPVQSPGGGGLL